VDDFDAKIAHLIINERDCLFHQLFAPVADYVDKGSAAEHAADRGIDDGCQTGARARLGPKRLVELQRIEYAIACKGVYDQALLVGSDNLLLVGFEVENAVVELLDGLHERLAPVKPGLGYHLHRLAEL